MFKKLLSLLMSLALVASLVACGGGSATPVSNSGSEATSSKDAVAKETNYGELLKSQIQNTPVLLEYPEGTLFNQMGSVTLGKDDGGDVMEWFVLDKNEDKALLIAKYAFGNWRAYGAEGDVKWESSDLRKYLNSEYINKTFNKNEQDLILTTDVINGDMIVGGSAQFGWLKSDAGNNTQDKVFILSKDELKKYFISDEQMKTGPKGFKDDYGWIGSYWTRTPFDIPGGMALADEGQGARSEEQHEFRPAIWVSIK